MTPLWEHDSPERLYQLTIDGLRDDDEKSTASALTSAWS
jgi:hypothetical protein